VKHRGMDFEAFCEMISYVFGIYNYPFAAVASTQQPMFNAFDKKNDGLIDFIEFAEGMNMLYKADTLMKARFIFELIDFHKMKNLGVREINKVFEMAYIDIFIDIKTVYNYFILLKNNKDKINMRDLFNNTNVMDKMHRAFDIVIDRNEDLKLYVSVLEVVHKFDIDKLRKLWDLFKIYFVKNYDNIKLSMQKKDSEASEVETMLLQNLFRNSDYLVQNEAGPFEITCQQFKIIMRELFKITDVQLLDDLFGNICGGVKYSKCLLEKFFESITYYFTCSFEMKVALVFEVYCVMRNVTEVPHDSIIDYIAKCFDIYWEFYKDAKKLVDDILDEQDIKFLNYKNLESKMIEKPRYLDSLFRFTLGKYSDINRRVEPSQVYLTYNEAEEEVKGNNIKIDKQLAIGYKNWNAK